MRACTRSNWRRMPALPRMRAPARGPRPPPLKVTREHEEPRQGRDKNEPQEDVKPRALNLRAGWGVHSQKTSGGLSRIEVRVLVLTRVSPRVGPVDEVARSRRRPRSEEHTSELQSPCNIVCRLLLE